MAVVTVKSTAISNRDAVPQVINDARIERGTLRVGKGSAAVGAADSIGSYYPMASVPSNVCIHGVLASAIAGMTLFAADIGVFKNRKDAGVDTGVEAFTGSAAFFGSAVSLATVLSRSEQTNESLSNTVAKREQPLWQAIGLSADPMTTFDIGFKATAANTGAAGTIGLEVHYSDSGT